MTIGFKTEAVEAPEKTRNIVQTEEIDIRNGKTLVHVITESLLRKDGNERFAPLAKVTIDLVAGTSTAEMQYPFSGKVAGNISDLSEFFAHAEKVATSAVLGEVFLKDEGILTPSL